MKKTMRKNMKKIKILTDKQLEKLEENIPLKDKIDKQLSRASDS